MTFSVPVHDGYVLHKSIVRYEVGGELLTEMLQRHLEPIRPRYSFKKQIKNYAEAGEEVSEFTLDELSFPNTSASFHNFAVREIVRDIKETHFKVSDSPYSDSSFANVPTVSYELPDGKVIELGNERFKIPELLFNNSAPLANGIVGFSGLHQMVNDSITRCDMDIRKELYGNIVVAGGNTLFPGFTDRLTRRLSDIASNMKVKLIASNSSIERRFSSWIGGSILASLGSFQQMWMSKQEYAEHGGVLVERKCP
jgi:actin-like protein 6A